MERARAGRTLRLMVICALALAGPMPARAHEGINNLIGTVDGLYQSGEITDVKITSNLIVSLQTIGELLDAGNSTTAGPLLAAFSAEVDALSGGGVSSSAAQTLITEANAVSAGL